jgi:hypothetical protein
MDTCTEWPDELAISGLLGIEAVPALLLRSA